jgi:hypothetical protein
MATPTTLTDEMKLNLYEKIYNDYFVNGKREEVSKLFNRMCKGYGLEAFVSSIRCMAENPYDKNLIKTVIGYMDNLTVGQYKWYIKNV